MFTHGLMQRRAAWMRRLAMSLTLALGFLPVSTLLPAANAQGTLPSAPPVKSILLFPSSADPKAGDGAAALTTRLDDAIKFRLSLVGDYTVITYSQFLPSVQRALSESTEGGLTDADMQPPFDAPKGEKIAALVGTDAYLVTTITSYTQDPTTRRVSLGVASRVFYSQSGTPVQGLGIGTSGVAGPTSASDSDLDIQQGAINDAAARIVSSFNAASPQARPIVATSSQRGSRGGAYVLGAILIGALIYAAIAGSHFGGGGGSSSGSGVAATTTTTTGPPSPPSGVGTTTTGGTPTPPAPPSSTSVRR